MEIEYDKLKRIAIEARAELAMEGQIDIAKGKVRKKPRDREKEELLFTMAIGRMANYRPRKEGDEIILPYFYP
jgi:hypothetical protein